MFKTTTKITKRAALLASAYTLFAAAAPAAMANPLQFLMPQKPAQQMPAPVEMQAQTTAKMGPLGDVLAPSGQEGVWRIYNGPEGFGLYNQADSSDLKYFYAGHDTRTEGKRTITTRLRSVGQGEGGMAGILYGYDASSRNYFFLAAQGDTLALYRRDQSGMNMMMSSGGVLKPNDFNTITITEQGDYIDISVDGNSIGGIGNGDIGKGQVGIAAWGTGSFEFESFNVKG